MLENNYIVGLVTPKQGEKKQSRKSWSIDLESVWIPFFTATNTMQATDISPEAIGAPLRLATDKNDGSVKFNKAGKPIIRVVKEISDNVKTVRENFVAGLQAYTHQVATSDDTAQAYTDMAKTCVEAGAPIIANDTSLLAEAEAKREEALIAEAINHAEMEEASKAPIDTTTEANQPLLVPA